MKNILRGFALAALLCGSGQAYAAAATGVATGDLNLSQSTPNTCAVMTSPTLSGSGFTLSSVSANVPGPGTVTATVAAPAGLINATTAQLDATGLDYNQNNALAFLLTNNSFALKWNAHCNFFSTSKGVRLTSQNGGLKFQGSTAAVGSFSDGLGTIMQLEWPTLIPRSFVNTTGNAGANAFGNVLLATNAEMTLRVKINKQLKGTTTQPSNPSNRAPLLAGTYTDVIKVAFGAPL